MEVARLIGYGIGLLTAVGLGLVLMRSKNRLGYMLAVAMFAWAFNCFSFGLMLVLKVWNGGMTPDISSVLWTINAWVLALVPIGLYVDLWGDGNGRDSSRS